MGRGGLAAGFAAAMVLQGCGGGVQNLDWDLRTNGGTAEAARSVGARPASDANGVISYPGYQVAVARQGDTVASVAARVGLAPDQLARFNALSPGDSLRNGEILALPVRVAAAPSAGFGAAANGIASGGIASGGIDVEAIASTAIDRTGAPTASTGASSAAAAPALPFSTTGSGPVPVRYQVKRGETAFTIARQFDISAKSLADWNGLPADLSVREGQYLIIPTAADLARRPGTETLPGEGSPTPLPPSATAPLPNEKTVTPQEAAAIGQQAPDLGAGRTQASASAMSMPVEGKIVRSYDGKTNQGIDIAAAAGSTVKAASTGTVAVVTKDASSGTTIVLLKHEGGLLTVYAGLDSASVEKGASLKRGAGLGRLGTGALHFEVRQGQQSVDPLKYLQ